MLIFVSSALALTPPAPLVLTTEQESLLAAGEIVVIPSPDHTTPAMGIATVDAPPELVIDAVIDLPARVEEIGVLQELTIYRDEPGLVAGKWVAGKFGIEATFHVLYSYDRAQGYCEFVSDTSQDNDVTNVQGSYQAYAYGDGSLMVYRSIGQGGGAVPGFLREFLQQTSMREQMGGMIERAEAKTGSDR